MENGVYRGRGNGDRRGRLAVNVPKLRAGKWDRRRRKEFEGLSGAPPAASFCRGQNSWETEFLEQCNTGYIAKCLLKQHQEPEKRSYKDEDSQQLFASKHSTCAQ